MDFSLVSISNKTVTTSAPFVVHFSVTGAVKPFTFPFSNESLTEDLIVFVKEEQGLDGHIL